MLPSLPITLNSMLPHLHLSAIFITLTSDNLILLLFGKTYKESGHVLAIQIWMVCSIFFGVSRQKWLIVENYLKDGLYVDMTGLALNIICNYFLIPRYGAIGASVASLVTSFTAHLVVAIFSKPIRLSIKMFFRSLTLPLRYLRSYSWLNCLIFISKIYGRLNS